MAKPDQIKLLPDSGAPIEQEVERNIGDIFNECRNSIETTWDRNEFDGKYRNQILSALHQVLKKEIGPLVENEIQLRRRGNGSIQNKQI